jgi:hypothetical protein
MQFTSRSQMKEWKNLHLSIESIGFDVDLDQSDVGKGVRFPSVLKSDLDI